MGASASATVTELWVFPVKGCQGIRVDEWEMAPTGLAYDRHWCVVDRNGTRFPEREYISGRKLPKLATIGVAFVGSGDAALLVLTAEGMQPLEVPCCLADYEDREAVDVRCSGFSTTDPESRGWQLGSIPSRSAGEVAEAWVTEYLNRGDVDPDHRKSPPARYMLVRGMPDAMRSVADYAGPSAKMGLEGQRLAYVNAHPGDGVAFQDWAPFLLTNLQSGRDLGARMGTTDAVGYPVLSCRGSIVVDGAPAWAEEDWLAFTIGGTAFRKLKECPRCVTPNRDQTTGEFLFEKGNYRGASGGRMKPMGTLRRAFPQKAGDAEWGIWAGPFFGVYVGHAGARGTLRVGTPVVVQRSRAVPRRGPLLTALLLLLLAVAVARRSRAAAAAALLAAAAAARRALSVSSV